MYSATNFGIFTDDEDDLRYNDLYNRQGNAHNLPPSELDDLVNSESLCTKGQALSLIFAFYLQHNISKTALEDLLILVNTISPNCVPGSKFLFEKFFFKDSTRPDVHFYCSGCKNYLGKFKTPSAAETQMFTCRFCVPPHVTTRSSKWLFKNNFY